MAHYSRSYEDLTGFPHFDFLLNFLYNIYRKIEKEYNMKVIKTEDFYRELKKYPVEMGMVPKSWISEIFNKIQFNIEEFKEENKK